MKITYIINEGVKLPSIKQRKVTFNDIKSANESYIKNVMIPDIINNAFNTPEMYDFLNKLANADILIACCPYEGIKKFERDFSPSIVNIVNVGNTYEIYFGVFNICSYLYQNTILISLLNVFNSILNEICEKNSNYISDIKLVNIDCSKCGGKGYTNRMGIYSMNYNDVYETFTKAELLDIVDSCKKTTYPTSTNYMINHTKTILYLPVDVDEQKSIDMYSEIHNYTSRYTLGNDIIIECNLNKDPRTIDTSVITLNYMKNVMHEFLGTNIKARAIEFNIGFECMIDWPQTTDVLQYAQSKDNFYIKYDVYCMIEYKHSMKKSKYPATPTLDTNNKLVNDILYDLFFVMMDEYSSTKMVPYNEPIYSTQYVVYYPKTNDFYLTNRYDDYDSSVGTFTPISEIVNKVIYELKNNNPHEISDIILELLVNTK